MGTMELFLFFWKDVMCEETMPGASAAILGLIGVVDGLATGARVKDGMSLGPQRHP